jgi:hypothetical protein
MTKTIGTVPVKVARTTSRLGFCGAVGSACCEFRSRRTLGSSIAASKASSPRQSELVSSASICGLERVVASTSDQQ